MSSTPKQQTRDKLLFTKIKEDHQVKVKTRKCHTRFEKRWSSLIAGLSDELNFTAHESKSASYARTITTSINVNKHRLRAMIDSGVTRNFISKRPVDRKGFTVRTKNDSYELSTINRTALQEEKVKEKTFSFKIAIQHHHEKLIFNVV